MNQTSDAIALAEQQVVDARADLLAEYQAGQVKVRHRIGSPLLIGGVLLGAIGVSYFALKRREPKSSVPWAQGLQAVKLLLPLWMAVTVASRSHS